MLLIGCEEFDLLKLCVVGNEACAVDRRQAKLFLALSLSVSVRKRFRFPSHGLVC